MPSSTSQPIRSSELRLLADQAAAIEKLEKLIDLLSHTSDESEPFDLPYVTLTTRPNGQGVSLHLPSAIVRPWAQEAHEHLMASFQRRAVVVDSKLEVSPTVRVKREGVSEVVEVCRDILKLLGWNHEDAPDPHHEDDHHRRPASSQPGPGRGTTPGMGGVLIQVILTSGGGEGAGGLNSGSGGGGGAGRPSAARPSPAPRSLGSEIPE